MFLTLALMGAIYQHSKPQAKGHVAIIVSYGIQAED